MRKPILRPCLRLLSLLLACLMLANFAACRQEQDDTEKEDPKMKDPTPTVDPIDLTALRQTGEDSQRWLSVPFSRLVLNPFEFNVDAKTTHTAYSDRPTLPLNLGYLNPYTTSGTGVWMEDLVALYAKQGGTSSAMEYQYEGNIWDADDWRVSGGSFTKLEETDDGLALTVKLGANESWQYAAQAIDLDLSVHPILTITVESSGGSWALKLCETGKADVSIQSDTSKVGTFTYDISALLKREDRFTGEIKLFSIGYDKTLVFSRLDIAKVESAYTEAKTYETAWTPSALDFSAEYATGLSLSGFDTFYDEATVLRTIDVQKPGDLTAAVKIDGSAKLQDAHTLIVTSQDGKYRYAVAWDADVTPLFYADLARLLTESDPKTVPTGKNFMALPFTGLKTGDKLHISVSLLSDASDAAACAEAAVKPLSDPACGETARSARDAYWTDFLNRVPRPTDFKISVVDAMGITPASIEQMYYIAWIFLGQNILPENPELSYPYPQVCCGKPSMWAYGEPKSAYSASWESFFGIQLLGYVMPDTAWSALQGLISLVDADGMLGGESLPSEKAHTAYLLYQLTGDSEKLASVYDGIARYLNWRMDNPRWIFQSHNDPDSADADFVASALIDMQFMQKICTALGRDTERAEWEAKHAAYLQNYYRWNFDEKGAVYQYCNKVTFARTSGCAIWTTKGLLVDGLDLTHQNYLMNRFNSEYNAQKTFGGFSGIKYPEISQTILGLKKIEKTSIAHKLAEICARDVVRCGMLSENYTNDKEPLPTGVRPAMFGCATMIDSVLLMNGFSYQDAATIRLGGAGHVDNVRIRNEFQSFGAEASSEND